MSPCQAKFGKVRLENRMRGFGRSARGASDYQRSPGDEGGGTYRADGAGTDGAEEGQELGNQSTTGGRTCTIGRLLRDRIDVTIPPTS